MYANTHSKQGFVRLRLGFTAIEAVVTTGMLAVLGALTLPMLQEAQRDVDAARCMTNERQLGLATLQYAMDHANRLPPRRGFDGKNWYAYLADGRYIPNTSPFACPVSVRAGATNLTTSYGYSDWLEWSGAGACPKKISDIPEASRTPMIAESDNYRFLRIYDWQMWFWPVSRHAAWGPMNWYAEGGYQTNNPQHTSAPIAVGWVDGHASMSTAAELLQSPYWGQNFQGCLQ